MIWMLLTLNFPLPINALAHNQNHALISYTIPNEAKTNLAAFEPPNDPFMYLQVAEKVLPRLPLDSSWTLKPYIYH